MSATMKMKIGFWRDNEGLKEEVMEYGKNQWSRISSFLTCNKTIKQLKGRLQEWLRPSGTKIKWTEQDDERLLHLAKLTPGKWSIIAQSLEEGRTPDQCLKRYEELLGTASTAHNHDDDDEQHTLCPGEIDPILDSVEMDEVEKQMVSETLVLGIQDDDTNKRRKLGGSRDYNVELDILMTEIERLKRKTRAPMIWHKEKMFSESHLFSQQDENETKGNVREKQPEDGSWLDVLQKAPDVENAGIQDNSKKKRKLKGINYKPESDSLLNETTKPKRQTKAPIWHKDYIQL